jgi:hypothetical protein
MSDVLVTVPLSFGLDAWIDEGQLPGEPWAGDDWDFYLYGAVPVIVPGERVYILYAGKIRGYAPLVRIDHHGGGRYSLVRRGGAVAVTIDRVIRGFRAWRNTARPSVSASRRAGSRAIRSIWRGR